MAPTGCSFDLDAFSIHLTLALVFIAQATDTRLSLGALLLVLGISLVTSKGAHGIPVIGLVLVLSVNGFIGTARALGNLIGNCVAPVVIAA